MRAFSIHSDSLQLGLADVQPDLAAVVERLGFERAGAVFVRRFPAEAPYAMEAAERFEQVAETIVRQLADLEPVPWEDALELVLERAPFGWTLVGSAARAIRGDTAGPHDIDLVSNAADAERIAEALRDLLVEPLLLDGGWIGARWWRAFAGARIEGVGDFAGAIVDEDVVSWRGCEVRVGRVA